MSDDLPLSLEDLRALEAQVSQQLAYPNGTLPFLMDGVLAVIRTAIAVLEEREWASRNQAR